MLRDVTVEQVKTERQVCEVLLKWFERRRAGGNDVTEPCRFLALVRWSGVDTDYIRTTVLNHAAIRQSTDDSATYLSRVLAFQTTGMQFDGLQTWHRLTTKLERCMLAVVGGGGSSREANMCAVSAQLTCSVEARFGGDLPFSGTPLEAAAAVVDSTMYVIGVGANSDQIWAYDATTGWRRRCADSGLVAGRRRHSVVAVGGQYVYSVAGYCPGDRSLVSFVERFDPSDNRSIVVDGADAVMPVPVFSAAAAAYGDDVYVFGGTNGQNETINAIQVL